MAALFDSRAKELIPYETLFAVAGQRCGYCWLQEPRKPCDGHMYWNCTAVADIAELKRFRRAVSYHKIGAPAGMPCFTCHISSMGGNRLHPQFKKGEDTCTQPNLLIPLAYAIWKGSLKRRAAKFFTPENRGHSWESLESFARWLGTHDRKHGWPSMALLRWVANTQLSVDHI
ncbi:hypothetical protein C8R43DRAFT_902967 [Mycena crocata]|nr:hypothetical protein C8R43DRAFT_902967 [Mycena crocata]